MMTTSHTTLAQSRFLEQSRQPELASLFATLTPGTLPRGRLRGRLMAVTGLDGLPRPLSRALYAILALPLNPWRGKLFDGDQGSNLWGRLRGARFGHFHISRHNGVDGHPSLWLDYDVDSNPAWLRAIRGEARQLQGGLWLCRMHWQTRSGLKPVLWFTLQGGLHAA